MPPGLWLDGTARFGGRALFGPLRFRAGAGQLTAILGPSGVGKSTLLRLFAGLAQAEFTGSFGADDGQPLQGRLALMAQEDGLLPWASALENVVIGARLRGELPDLPRARALLADCGLEGMDRRRPPALSGGQRQRVALARCLYEDRPVVLLDEPFSALDALTRARMQDLAARLLAGRTVLLVTHDTAEAARLADHILLLSPEGLTDCAVPEGPPPRAHDAAGVLATQAALLSRMMAAA